RGHYARSDALQRYFRTLMWFGLVPFAIEREGKSGTEPNPVQIRQSALMVQDLYDSGALAPWQRVYDLTAMYVGDSNDLTPSQWRQAVRPILGWPQRLDELAKSDSPAKVDAAIKKVAHPMI